MQEAGDSAVLLCFQPWHLHDFELLLCEYHSFLFILLLACHDELYLYWH